MYTSAGRILY